MYFNELVSFVILIVFTAVSFVMWAMKKRSRNKLFSSITPMKVFTTGFIMALSAFVFLALVSKTVPDIVGNGFKTIKSVKSFFKLDLAPSDINPAKERNGQSISAFGRYYLTVLDIIIPIITLRVVYSAFRDYLTQWAYFFGRFRRFHIFSVLNEKSIDLAEDIFKNEKNCSVIFTNVSDKYSEGLLERAKLINAHFTHKTIVDFSYFKRKNYIYILGDDDFSNMSIAIEINEILNGKQADGDVFVLSSLDSSPEYIDAVNLKKGNSHCYAHLINRAQLITYNLLFEYPLFKAAEKAKSNKISVLTVGAGYIGMEFARASMWAGLMSKYDYEITIIDVEDKEDRFAYDVGDINSTLKDIGVNIDFTFESADVKSAKFKELIRKHSDANYIVVALGNNELTADTSVTIRRELTRASVEKGIYDGTNSALIFAIIGNENYAALLSQLSEDYEIIAYGSHRCIFSQSGIGYSNLDKIASYINWEYSRDRSDGFSLEEAGIHYKKASEISKISSRAAAVRTLYNLKEAGVNCSFDEGGNGKSLSLEEADELLRVADLKELEHKRWSAFMALNGWKTWNLHSDGDYISIEIFNNRYNKDTHKLAVAKLHGCLVRQEKLNDIFDIAPSAEDREAMKNNDIKVVNVSARALSYTFENIRFIKDNS